MDDLPLFKSLEGQKQIADAITKKMEECRPGGPNPDQERFDLFKIFRAALSATDLSNLDPDKKLPEESLNKIIQA